jgi:CRP/FNR family transcriptional activator FtrB
MTEPPLDRGVLLQLQVTPLFAGLAEAVVADLVDGAAVVALAPESPLFQAGEVVERFFVVLDGHVEVSVEADGRRSVVEVVRQGAVLGDAGLFAGGRFQTSARLLTAATLLAVPAAAFVARLEQRFDVQRHMLTTMSLRLRMLVRQIAELKLKTTAQRLGSFLLSLTAVPSGRVELRFPYDKKLVADELGMKPESLSRALAKLARVGVESRPDNTVAVADIARLRQFCVEDDVG